MTDRISNDNDAAMLPDHRPDAHGQSAMLLVESLMHGLIARSVITVDDAIEIVEGAADIEHEIAAEHNPSPESASRSSALLNAIRLSLTSEL